MKRTHQPGCCDCTPCIRWLTSRIVWDDTGRPCDATDSPIVSHTITRQDTGQVVASSTNATCAADLSGPGLGPGVYLIHARVDNAGRLCETDGQVTIEAADCAVEVTSRVCCPRYFVAAHGCRNIDMADEIGRVAITVEEDGSTANARMGQPDWVTIDPNLSAPYPERITLSGVATTAGYDATPIVETPCFSCGGQPLDPICSVSDWSHTILQPFVVDADHTCFCANGPVPRTLYYSDVEGGTCELYWSDAGVAWYGAYTVTDSCVHVNGPDIGTDPAERCMPPSGTATSIIQVELLCQESNLRDAYGRWKVTWVLSKRYATCSTPQQAANPFYVYLFDPTSAGLANDWPVPAQGDPQASDSIVLDRTDEFPAALNFVARLDEGDPDRIYPDGNGGTRYDVCRVLNACTVTA